MLPRGAGNMSQVARKPSFVQCLTGADLHDDQCRFSVRPEFVKDYKIDAQLVNVGWGRVEIPTFCVPQPFRVQAVKREPDGTDGLWSSRLRLLHGHQLPVEPCWITPKGVP